MNEPIVFAIAGGAVLALSLAAVLLRNRLSDRAKEILLGLVAEAEVLFGAKTGEIKYSSVLGHLYAIMPKMLQTLFSKKTVDAWIEDALSLFKEKISEKNETEKG